jgi:coiled-coil-helix-coiled-coil-helix domain-containing protein 2
MAPPAAHHPPAQGGGMMSGLGGTLMTGMAFGAGSEVAHQAVRGLMGSGSSSHGGQQENAPQQYQAQQAPTAYGGQGQMDQ